MTERRDIGARLENWGRVYRNQRDIGISPTGAFCDQLKREALGEQPSGERRKPDEADARLVELAMRHLTYGDRKILKLCYIDQERPEAVCRVLRLPQRPGSVFVAAFRKAQAAVEVVLGSDEKFHAA